MLTPSYTGTSRSSYQGTLSIGGVIVWSCPHAHDTSALRHFFDADDLGAQGCCSMLAAIVEGRLQLFDDGNPGFGAGDSDEARARRMQWWWLQTVEPAIPRLRALVQHAEAGGTVASFEAAEREQAEAAKVA